MTPPHKKRADIIRTLCTSWVREKQPNIYVQLAKIAEKRVPLVGRYKSKPGPKPKQHRVADGK